jgi:hypothetical protein
VIFGNFSAPLAATRMVTWKNWRSSQEVITQQWNFTFLIKKLLYIFKLIEFTNMSRSTSSSHQQEYKAIFLETFYCGWVHTYHYIFVSGAILFFGVFFRPLNSFQAVERFFIKLAPLLDRYFIEMLLPRIRSNFYINLK